MFRKKRDETQGGPPPPGSDPGGGGGGGDEGHGGDGGGGAGGGDGGGGEPTEVTLHDAFGRPTRIPREQWRRQVLPQMIDAFVHAPDRLASLILQGLRDRLAPDLLPAALRLAAVDPDPERGLAVLAAVQRESGDLEASQGTLVELQQKRPRSVAARVGQALLRDRAGDRAGATALLWEALQIDPNHADALHGFLQWEHQRTGADGYRAVLATVCGLEGGWRPQLWRARNALERGDEVAAERDFRDVAARAGDESDALAMMATDLVRAGKHELVRELVLPRYRLDRHHPTTGLQLLQHYRSTRQPEAGLDLLHRLRVRFQRAFDRQLAPFDAEFTRMSTPPPAPNAAPSRIVLYRVDRPLWFAPLREPEFLVEHSDDPPRVLFAGLSSPLVRATTAVTREDELGRMTRAVPLFLADRLWAAGAVRAGVVLPVADVGGWVVSGTPWAEQRLAELLPEDERAGTRIVTGSVRAEGSRRRFDLWVYDCASGHRTGHAAAEGEADGLGALLLQLLDEVAPLVGMPVGEPGARPPFGSEAHWQRYAAGLGQLAALVVAQLGQVPKEQVHGHRAILEWLLGVAIEERANAWARLLLSAGLCADVALGSRVHLELAAPFAELFRLEPAAGAFAQTAVLPLRAMGLDHLWQHRRAEILAAAGDGCRDWLLHVEATGG